MKKFNIKVVSPNFDLEYGLKIDRNRKKIKKINKI